MDRELILLTGASSFLGSSFANFLLNENIQHVKISSTINNNAYSLNNLKKIFEKYNIRKVIDFYFPKVSSLNSDLINVNFDFTLQENLIHLFNERKNFKTFFISTLKKDNSIYSLKKMEQENLYKINLPKDNLEIFYAKNIFGPGDFNLSRLIPFFFNSILKNKKVNFYSDGSAIRNFMYIDEFNNTLYNQLNDSKIFNSENLEIKVSSFISLFSHDVLTRYNIEHEIHWKNNIKNLHFELNNYKKNYHQISKTTDWYISEFKKD